MTDDQLPRLQSSTAYDRLRKLRQLRRRTGRIAIALFIANVIAVSALLLVADFQRYFVGG